MIKEYILGEMETNRDILAHIMRKEALENITLTGLIESRGKEENSERVI